MSDAPKHDPAHHEEPKTPAAPAATHAPEHAAAPLEAPPSAPIPGSAPKTEHAGHGAHDAHDEHDPHGKAPKRISAPGSNAFAGFGKYLKAHKIATAVAGGVAAALTSAVIAWPNSNEPTKRDRDHVESSENDDGEEIIPEYRKKKGKTATQKRAELEKFIEDPFKKVQFTGSFSKNNEGEWQFTVDKKEVSKNTGERVVKADIVSLREEKDSLYVVLEFVIDNKGDALVYEMNERQLHIPAEGAGTFSIATNFQN